MKTYEDRPNWASCFAPKSSNSKASFIGVVALDGRRYWVNVYEKEAKNGSRYLSVHLAPQDQTEKPQANQS